MVWLTLPAFKDSLPRSRSLSPSLLLSLETTMKNTFFAHKKEESCSLSFSLSLTPVLSNASSRLSGEMQQQPPPGSSNGGGGVQPLPVLPVPMTMQQQAPPPPPPPHPSSSSPPPLQLPPPPRAGYRPGGGGEGFSEGQLHVLRHQIMAYRAIKVRLIG